MYLRALNKSALAEGEITTLYMKRRPHLRQCRLCVKSFTDGELCLERIDATDAAIFLSVAHILFHPLAAFGLVGKIRQVVAETLRLFRIEFALISRNSLQIIIFRDYGTFCTYTDHCGSN